jgi:hypothetical protein
MYLTTKQIRKQIKILQPGIKFPLYRDRQYYVIPHADLSQLIEDHKAEFEADLPQEEMTIDDLITGAPEDEDCDDWADSFRCFVRRHYRRHKGINKAAAVSVVIGLQFDGVEINHTKNIVITDAGCFFVDAKTKQVKTPDQKEDKSWFVSF